MSNVDFRVIGGLVVMGFRWIAMDFISLLIHFSAVGSAFSDVAGSPIKGLVGPRQLLDNAEIIFN